MKNSKKKKTILGIAPSVAATGITLLVRGQTGPGVALIGISSVLFVLYDYLDDQAKGNPTLPVGVDEELLTRVGTEVGQEAEEQIEKYRSEDK